MNAASPTLFSKDARAVAGRAQAVELLSRTLTDKEALPLLDDALQEIRAAFNDPAATVPDPGDPNRMHPLFIAEAALRINRSRRVTSLPERIDELERAQQDLETVPGILRPEIAWMMLAVCLTERAIAQPASRPGTLDEATQCVDFVYKKNPNAAHALRQKAIILMRSADDASWNEAEPLLEQAQDLLEQSRALDPVDYLATGASADVLLQLAERLPREKAKELVSVAKERYADAAKLDASWPNAFTGLAWADLLLARRASGAESLAFAEAVMGHAEEALNRRPDSVRALRLKGIARYRAARVAPREGAQALFEESFKYYEEGNRLHPEDYFLLTDWAFAHLAQAGRREGVDAVQSLDAAEQKAQEALKLQPEYAHGYVALADISRRRAQLGGGEQARSHLDSAVRLYESALKISPDLESALTGAAMAATRISELAPKEKRGEGLPEAEQRLRRALDLRGDNEYAWEALGEVLWRQALDRQDYAVAIRAAKDAYDRAWKIDPQLDHSQLRLAEIGLSLALIDKDANLMAQTIEAFRAAARQFPERARAHSGLGEALAESVISRLSTGNLAGQLEESIAEFKQAANLDRRNVSIHHRWRKAVEELAKVQPDKKDHLTELARLDEIIGSLTAPKVA